jgi:electron transfer flavoprotein alpha subunit
MEEGIWVLVEHKGGKILKVSQEILSEAGRLCAKVNRGLTALVIGSDLKAIVEAVCYFNVSTVCTVDDAGLSYYVREAYSDVVQKLITKYNPSTVLYANTTQGIEVAGSVAAAMKKGLVTNCVGLEYDDQGDLLVTKSVYGGKVSVVMKTGSGKPQIASILPGYFEIEQKNEPGNPKIINEQIALGPEKFVITVQETIKGNPKTIDLSEAEIIVAGGKGTGSHEGFSLINELAEALGGTVGASRAAVDKGLAPSIKQIGQTGKTVSPELFISFGISGAIQFTMGMKDSQIIIANDINKSVPILKMADISIVGDLHKIIPALIQEITRKKSERTDLSARNE